MFVQLNVHQGNPEHWKRVYQVILITRGGKASNGLACRVDWARCGMVKESPGEARVEGAMCGR
jgi:hypothetical protein